MLLLVFVASGAQAQSSCGLAGSFCQQAVGQSSGQQSVTVKARAAGVVSAVEVLTQGVGGLDFEAGHGANTCAGATLAADATCIEPVTFTPLAPGVRIGAVVLLDGNGNVLGWTPLGGVGVAGLGVLSRENLLPVAGVGLASAPLGDGGIASAAGLSSPASLAMDGAGNLYIADRGNNRIRMVAAGSGLISTIAGNGQAGYTGDGLGATDSGVSLNSPSGVAVDGAGNLYIADTGNNVVRQVAASTGVISTVAGTGAAGSGGDGGPAAAARLNGPQGLLVDAMGELYIADTANHRIRRVDLQAGTILTVAGNGTVDRGDGVGGYTGDGGPAAQAELNFPLSVALDATGNLYIADSANSVVRMVAAMDGQVTANSTITTFAGSGIAGDSGDGGAATEATLALPSALATDAAGNVYIADAQSAAIRKVSAASGLITTVAANGAGKSIDASGAMHEVELKAPLGLVSDGRGDLFVADAGGMQILQLQGNMGLADFTGSGVRQGDRSAPQIWTIENRGNAPLELTAMAAGSNTALDAGTTTCAVGRAALAVNSDCALGVIFAPASPGDPLAGQLLVTEDAVNSPLTIALEGDATPVNTTNTAIASSLNPAGFGQTVTFTASVDSGGETGNLTGAVTFLDGAMVLGGPVSVNSAGQATYQTGSLAVGNHTMTASYSGDAAHGASSSSVLQQVVIEGSSATLASSVNPSAVGQRVTFTGTVTAASGGVAPVGSVVFSDGSSMLATVVLGAGGQATFTTTSLANGTHGITAAYSGDAASRVAGSVSNVVVQVVPVASQMVLTAAPNPSSYGGAVTFSVTAVSAGTHVPAGTVNILDGGAQIGSAQLAAGTGMGTFSTSALAVGTHNVTANYQGDAYNSSSTSGAVSQQVGRALTGTELSANPNPAAVGSLVTLTAVVVETQGTATPTGLVTFFDSFNNAVTGLGTVSLGAGGTVSLNATLAIGEHSITATYDSDMNNLGSSSDPLVVAVGLPPSKVVLTSSQDPSAASSSMTFLATVSGGTSVPAGSVTFVADGGAIGAGTLDAKGTAALTYAGLGPGTHAVSANYAGDAGHAAGTSASLSQVVNLLATTTVLTSPKNSAGLITLSAAVAGTSGPAATGTVTFTVGTETLGTAVLDGTGTATLTPNLAAGTYTIVATYGGDALHAGSSSQPIGVTEPASAFTLTVSPGSATLGLNSSAQAMVTLAATGGFSGTISLSCGGLPSGVSCQYSSSQLSLAAGASGASQLTISTGSAVGAPTGALAGVVCPFGVFFGMAWIWLRRRRGKLAQMLQLVLWAAAVMLASGCTVVMHANGDSAVSYVVQLKATAQAGNITQSQDFTVIVQR